MCTVGQTLRGVTMKKCGRDELRSQLGNDVDLDINVFPYVFFVQLKALHMAKSKNSSGVYRPKYKKIAHFSLVLLSPRTRSRPGAERIRQGEGRLSRPPKTALERSYLTKNSSSENRILSPRRRKTPDRIPERKNDHTYIYVNSKCEIFTILVFVFSQ